MPILSPSELKQLCAQYGLSPSKHYGQHYLISDAPIKKMIEAGELTKDDTVIEIGPGFGVLTLAVAPLVKKVIAFEIEQKLKPYWEEKIKEFPNVEIVWGNFLHVFNSTSYQLPATSYKVLANLPYQITSDALRVMLELQSPPKVIVVMVQKEVAERICAKPPDMSLLSVAVQYYGEPKIVARVPAGVFWPAPKVDSAIIKITPSPFRGGLGGVSQQFFKVVRAGFSNKRKQLWRNLSAGLALDPQFVKNALQDVMNSEKVRAQELSVDNWRAILWAISNSSDPYAK